MTLFVYLFVRQKAHYTQSIERSLEVPGLCDNWVFFFFVENGAVGHDLLTATKDQVGENVVIYLH